MFGRISRRSFLIVFAFLNLAVWVAAAAVVGLVVSDRVDLGVETLIRQRQATAVAAWDHVVSAASETREIAPSDTITSMPAATEAPVGVAAVQTSEEYQEPEAKVVEPTASETSLAPEDTARVETPASPEPVALPTRRDMGTPAPTSSATQAPGSFAAAEAAPPAKETPIESPLLMRDLQFGDLMFMDREMGRSAVGRLVQIRYSEAVLNQEIEALLDRQIESSEGTQTYQNVYVDLRRDHAVVTGDVTVLGFEVSTEIVGTVTAKECLPQMDIQSVSVGGALTPGFVKNQIQELLLDALKWYPANHPLCLEQIILEEDRATVYGHRR